jgi:FlaA1/EpsC-like NDP-sugar epimerase
MFLYVVRLSRGMKIITMILCDIVLLPLALWSAIALRLGTFEPDVSAYPWLFVIIPITTIIIFAYLGLYRTVIRYTNDKVVYTIIYGVTLSVLVLAAIVAFWRMTSIPRSSLIIYWVTAIAFITLSRYMARGFLLRISKESDNRQKVAIYGAGRAGFQTALALISSPEYRPVAFFDDNPNLHGRVIAGIRVYNPKYAIEIMEKRDAKQLLLAIPSCSRSRRKEIIKDFEGKDIILKTLPGIGDLVDGKVRVEDIREVGIEDLLGRDPVPPHEELITACITDKVVMVTGAGGSIGSELCRQILRNRPTKLILFEQNEYNLYRIEQELQQHYPSIEIISILGDVLNQSYVESMMEKYKVETLYHAAAYKHVPIVENNIIAGVMNNVFGTLAVAKAAISQKISTFVLISTDKAVRPTNVMGASKRLAELVLQGLSQDQSIKTRFCMVRFGNVLGSSGSVVPLFKEQIQKGGPVTVTHPEITRFFMTIPEAAQLVIQAGAMGTGGDVFVLDMGESVKIVDLARKMIEFSGFEVYDPETKTGDIEITFTGLRPGEKLYEELLLGSDIKWTRHPCIMRSEEKSLELSYLIKYLEELNMKCQDGDFKAVKATLKHLVPEYTPRDEGTC